ncbi:anti-phage dCTP deaminase [Aeromonas hydrophila]|uniref:anti-phage dCTP deaminase n=3 Tax=Aeromonas hydrophila TaxID=644 RepID=UPI000FD16613|nr:anti-phage dCTP deaminase [Aeromonas hydrophila]AZU48589.1 cytidine deaminase [Aeromonas hydrophila]QBX70915.1 cytidine deaminase [Aeromonas hydrophila]QBX75640.1 cytidine deaminase [Aeromonas hydrophila]WDA26050.1 anti-phage dCTP deaminase [Aeromonas hydrophila]WES91927.1 anti-phage dCTP deaminase [Aeromonas hydrophila]
MIFDKNFDLDFTGGELVLGLVAPVGIDLDIVTAKLKLYLEQYSYKVITVHVSQLASEFFPNRPTPKTQLDRIQDSMELCSKLRKEYERNDFFSLSAIDFIAKNRPKDDLKYRTAYIIRSLKHPDEVDTLKKVYAHGFYLIGITASQHTRLEHLRHGLDIRDNRKSLELIEKDNSEETKYGQNTRDVFHNADVFIDLDDNEWDKSIARFTDLIFGNPLITPTANEHAMFMAYMASVRSGDLSRQVGAVITNSYHDVIALGANDVPKFGGGQYWPGSHDMRDLSKEIDPNEQRRNEIILNVLNAIEHNSSNEENNCSHTEEEKNEDKIARGKELLKDTGILDLTEYGRAVHAEMEALLSAARNGTAVRGATLFTTTFPCHNCAKHIIAAGITKVRYIEPYPKSYAQALHNDSIDVNPIDHEEKEPRKVIFEPFVGIGPRRYLDLFSMALGSGGKIKRKLNGQAIKWYRVDKSPRVSLQKNNYIHNEDQYCSFFKEFIKDKSNDHSNDPICKKCKSIMVRRISTKGISKGKSFWGCSKYPHCQYSETIQ